MASARLAKMIRKSSLSPPVAEKLSASCLAALFDPTIVGEIECCDVLPTSLSVAPPSLIAAYVRDHLPAGFSPAQLLRFLRTRLIHHPSLSAHDLRVFLWAASLDSFRHDHSTYTFMALRLASTARAAALRPLLRRCLISHPCPCSSSSIFSCPHLPPLLRSSLLALCRAGRLHDARHTLRDIKHSSDGPLTADLYNILISAYSKHGRHLDALQLFDEMVQHRVHPDVFTFNILIHSSCRNSTFESALAWFYEMRSSGCGPNIVTFNTLIAGFFRLSRFKEGIGIAQEMLHLGYGLSSTTCAILIKGLCQNDENVTEAAHIMMDFANRGAVPDDFDCFELVQRLCNRTDATRVDQALALVNLLWEKGNNTSAVTCTALIEGLRRSRKLDKAHGVMEKMLDKGMTPDVITFNCLLEDLCNAGRTADANKLKNLGCNKGLRPDDATYWALIRGFTREGGRYEGQHVVDEMLDMGFIPNIATYNRLMEGLKS